MFAEAFEEFSASRLWEFEEIEIDWKLEGMLQADLNEGLNNLLENNPLQAEASLNTVISKDSGVWQAYYYRAAARKQLKKFTSAQRDMQRSLKLHSDFYEGYVELAKILHLQNKYEESEKAIKRAIKLDPSKGTAYYLRGDINLSQNEVKSAINNYRDCLAADSLYHDARIKLALLDLLSKKDQSRALKHLNQVLVYDSLQKTALLFRSLLVADKDKKQSIRDLTNLIRVSPENLMAYYYRGVLSTELENYDQAFPDFQKVIKVTSASDNNFVGQQTWIDKKIDLQNAGAYTLTRVYGLPEGDGLKLKQAFCLIITEAFDKSIAIIDKIPDVENEPLALYLKAVAHEHKGDHNKALQLYHGALALDNEIADAHKKRAIYAQELKLWGESIKDLNEVLRLTPDAYIIHRIRGVSYFHNAQYVESLNDFNTYLQYDSGNKEVIGYRGMAYLNTNQPLKAFVDFAVSNNHHALNFLAMEKLIDSVLHLPDTSQTLYYLDEITSSAPHFTEGYVQKFKIHQARNQWKEIEDNITRALRYSRADADNRKHAYLMTLQAIVYARFGHHEDAIKVFEEVIKLDKKNALAYFERAKVLLALGKTAKAENDLNQASSLGYEQAKQLLATMTKSK